MSETQHKEARAAAAFTPGQEPGDGGGLPAQPGQALPEAPFLNPAPKAALLGLALLLMTGYAHFVIGFADFAPAPVPAPTSTVTTPGMPQTAPPQTDPQQATPPQAGSQTPDGQTPEAQPDEAAARAHREKIAKLGRNPRLMSSQSYTDENLNGLSLQNSTVSKASFKGASLQNSSFYKMRLSGCVFSDADLSKADIREVSFEDCTFENVNIDEATLFNVNFINCSFSGKRWEQGVSKMRVALSRMYNVTFEKARLDTFELFMNIGRVTFTDSDLTSLRLNSDGNNRYFPKAGAGSLPFRLNLEKCTGGDFDLSLRSVESELKITDSDLENVKLNAFSKIHIQDSRITGQGFIEAREWLVIKDSTLCANFRSYGPMYLVNNAYISQRATSRVNAFLKDEDGMQNTSKLRPAGGSPCYIIGGADEAWLTTFGGKIDISDLKIRMGYFELDNSSSAASELNLKNVSIDKGHIYNSDLRAAYWEKVKILNPMTSRNIRNQRPLAVRMSEVSLPEGERWIDSELYSIEEVVPRKWSKPEIPELK